MTINQDESRPDPYEFLREKALNVANEMEEHRNARDAGIGRRATAGEKPDTVREKVKDNVVTF